MAKLKIKRGDEVIVLTGRDKGKRGKVLKVSPSDLRLVVGGVNLQTKHRKPSQASGSGSIDKIEASIHVSNVALVDPQTGKPTRVGYKLENAKKVRVARASGAVIGGE